MLGCCRFPMFAVLAVVVVSVVGQSSERALNTTGLWSKYNLIVKPTADGAIGTTPPATDARYKSGVVLKNKYGLKTDDKDLNRPYLTNHRISIDSGSEEEQISQEAEDDVTEEEGDDAEEDEEEAPISDEQDDVRQSTTQRSQAIHHKAPVKVAVIDATTKKSIERKTTHKKKKGHKPSAATSATTVIHHHHLDGEDDDIDLHGHQKGHKHKGVKKYKIKGLKKLRKYMLPLLLAYKLKFFTLVPLLIGGLILIVASTGFAGFFFALFAVGVGLKKD